MAYYAVTTQNLPLLQQAINECRLYRDILRTDSTHGLWRHIFNPSSTPGAGHWSTGNAWAAAGMTRILATVMKAPDYLIPPDSPANAVIHLIEWIKEILDAAMASPMDQTTKLP